MLAVISQILRMIAVIAPCVAFGAYAEAEPLALARAVPVWIQAPHMDRAISTAALTV
jgi:hypothetical protein